MASADIVSHLRRHHVPVSATPGCPWLRRYSVCTSCASDGCDAWLACEVSDGCDACQLQAQVDNRYALSRTQLLADLSAAPTHEELLQGPTHAPEATLKVKHVSRRSLPAATYEGHILTESEASCTEAERDTIYVDASTGMIVGGVLSREVQEKIGAVFKTLTPSRVACLLTRLQAVDRSWGSWMSRSFCGRIRLQRREALATRLGRA